MYAVNVPELSISEVQTTYTFCRCTYLPGTTLNYSALNMTFLVDENLENFEEIHGWIRGLGFPESYTEYADGLAAGADRFPTSDGSCFNRTR